MQQYFDNVQLHIPCILTASMFFETPGVAISTTCVCNIAMTNESRINAHLISLLSLPRHKYVWQKGTAS